MSISNFTLYKIDIKMVNENEGLILFLTVAVAGI